MVKKTFGKTGIEMSALGFGAMRMPMFEKDGKKYVDEDKSIPMLHKAFELGVNYVDTALYYMDGLSEITVGKALRSWKGGRVYLATKNPVENDSGPDWMKRLETSLKKLEMDSIDFYHMWGIGLDSFKNKVMAKDGPMDMAVKAKEQGLIKHISFSYHDKPENMKEIIDSGYFESVLLQYNLLDRSNEENINYAHEKGLGIVVMGPVAGGRLGVPSKVIEEVLGAAKPVSTPEMALRFVLANPKVHVALSGMETMEMVIQNAEVASRTGHLTAEEQNLIQAMLEETKRLMDLYCTGCNYCMPCPAGINIPRIFEWMNYHKVYGLTDYAKQQFALIGNEAWGPKYKPVSECTGCGGCEAKCPQKLEVIKQLKETEKALS
ncbi:MAG: aldo/keto reductase [Defluviitaleaceae bacterium]|nr:aldo/keto reductase [Defluviitaleaceae bacterium]MCL2835759.1 aldo/keto reductase [Defluviitaleaceae bacterium]